MSDNLPRSIPYICNSQEHNYFDLYGSHQDGTLNPSWEKLKFTKIFNMKHFFQDNQNFLIKFGLLADIMISRIYKLSSYLRNENNE